MRPGASDRCRSPAPAGRRRRAGGRRCCGPTPAASAPRRNGRAREVGLDAEARAAPPRACGAPWPGRASRATTGRPSAAVYQPGPEPRSTAMPAGRRCAEGLGRVAVPRLAAALVVRARWSRRTRRCAVHGTRPRRSGGARPGRERWRAAGARCASTRHGRRHPDAAASGHLGRAVLGHGVQAHDRQGGRAGLEPDDLGALRPQPPDLALEAAVHRPAQAGVGPAARPWAADIGDTTITASRPACTRTSALVAEWTPPST